MVITCNQTQIISNYKIRLLNTCYDDFFMLFNFSLLLLLFTWIMGSHYKCKLHIFRFHNIPYIYNVPVRKLCVDLNVFSSNHKQYLIFNYFKCTNDFHKCNFQCLFVAIANNTHTHLELWLIFVKGLTVVIVHRNWTYETSLNVGN